MPSTGYRLLDGAAGYGNEHLVGQAMAEVFAAGEVRLPIIRGAHSHTLAGVLIPTHFRGPRPRREQLTPFLPVFDIASSLPQDAVVAHL